MKGAIVSEPNGQEFEVKTAAGTLRARGYDAITIVLVAYAVFSTYFLFTMVTEVRISNKQLTEAMGQIISTQKEMACILALPQEQRLQEIGNMNSFCKRISKS